MILVYLLLVGNDEVDRFALYNCSITPTLFIVVKKRKPIRSLNA